MPEYGPRNQPPGIQYKELISTRKIAQLELSHMWEMGSAQSAAALRQGHHGDDKGRRNGHLRNRRRGLLEEDGSTVHAVYARTLLSAATADKA